MDNRHFLNVVQLGMGGLPVAFSTSYVIIKNPLFCVFTIMIIVISSCFLPLYKRRANLWEFVFIAIGAIPINLYLLFIIAEYDLFFTILS